MPKYNDIDVRLVDVAECGFDVIGRVRAELRRNGVDPKEITEFTEQALFGAPKPTEAEDAVFGDYSHLARVCTEWVRIS